MMLEIKNSKESETTKAIPAQIRYTPLFLNEPKAITRKAIVAMLVRNGLYSFFSGGWILWANRVALSVAPANEEPSLATPPNLPLETPSSYSSLKFLVFSEPHFLHFRLASIYSFGKHLTKATEILRCQQRPYLLGRYRPLRSTELAGIHSVRFQPLLNEQIRQRFIACNVGIGQ